MLFFLSRLLPRKRREECFLENVSENDRAASPNPNRSRGAGSRRPCWEGEVRLGARSTRIHGAKAVEANRETFDNQMHK